MNTVEHQKKMEKVLTRLVIFLKKSKESAYASQTPKELVKIALVELNSIQSIGKLHNPNQIENLFLPTASLQDIAIDNGWGEDYLAIAEHFELVLKACR